MSAGNQVGFLLTLELANRALFYMGVYFGVGALFAVIFVALFVGRLDRSATGGKFLFRLIILPGVVTLWPIILVRVLSFRVINKAPDGEGRER
ncbi:MAG: hypothetical protein AAF850_08460 [Pseudomonadota bacterium]